MVKKDIMTGTSGISAYQNGLMTQLLRCTTTLCFLMEFTDLYFFAIFLICRYENPYNMNEHDALFSINLFQ